MSEQETDRRKADRPERPGIGHVLGYAYINRVSAAFDRLCSTISAATPVAAGGAQTRFAEEVRVTDQAYDAACHALLPDQDRASDEEIYKKLPTPEGGIETDAAYRARILEAAAEGPELMLEKRAQIDAASGPALDAIGESYGVVREGRPTADQPGEVDEEARAAAEARARDQVAALAAESRKAEVNTTGGPQGSRTTPFVVPGAPQAGPGAQAGAGAQETGTAGTGEGGTTQEGAAAGQPGQQARGTDWASTDAPNADTATGARQDPAEFGRQTPRATPPAGG